MDRQATRDGLTGPAARFLQDLRRSGLVDPARFGVVRAQVEGDDSLADPKAVARRLVRDGILTPYQAHRLLTGRSDGLVIGRYEVLGRLGTGDPVRVFKARHTMLRRPVALKLLDPQLGHRGEKAARFRREMRLVGRLDHPNLVAAYDADCADGLHYIAMEYVSGASLDAILPQWSELGLARALWIGRQAARGLAYIHGRGIVHRNIKPSNIMLGRDGRVRLLDLGLGVLLERDLADECQTVVGTPLSMTEYASPELMCGREVDGRSDIYSLGCTLIHLTSGRLPFAGDSSVERMAAQILGRTIPLGRLMPGQPAPVRAVLERMVARDPADRYQSAAGVEAALGVLLAARPTREAVKGRAEAEPVMQASERS